MNMLKEPIRYEAVIQCFKDELPDLKDAKVIITNQEDGVYIGVRSVYRNFTQETDRIFVQAEQVGDYCKIDHTRTIAELFDCLKQMLERVSAMVEAGNKGEPIVGNRINGDEA